MNNLKLKSIILSSVLILILLGCSDSTITSSNIVKNNVELQTALSEAKPGDHIVMANGEWEDVQIKVTENGTESQPIKLSAETPGKVLLQGASNLQLGADFIIVDGLYFVNGASPSKSVIHFAADEAVANHCIVRNCVVKDFNKNQKNQQDLWVLFQGRNNELDHCYLAGKSNKGPTVRVDLEGNQNINNYHKITNNHFGPRPPKGGPSAETIQIGNSYTSMCPSYTLVANNLFEECNGEVEIISSKTNFNEFRNNVFFKSEGSLVTRHGNYCTVDGNYFIGDETESNVGGIRLIGTGHIVTNNYFYNLRGKEFRSPLAVMNGIPKSPLNRYIQVTDVIVAYNSWINCTSPLQFGVGSNISQKDVLPASEIRSARPKRTIVANNLIYNTNGDETPIVAHDKLDGIRFENNFINNQGRDFETVDGLNSNGFELEKITDYIMVPKSELPGDEIFEGFGFDKFNTDLFGTSREEQNAVGAITGQPNTVPDILNKAKYGPDWYSDEDGNKEPITHKVSEGDSIAEVIDQASDGDIIELMATNFEIKSPLKINKALTIKSSNKVKLNYSGDAKTPLFEMNPKGKLTLINLNLSGNNTQYAFASLKENMSSLYNLDIQDCVVENFDHILKAYKHSFSENIYLTNSVFKNCQNGLVLSEENDDRGEYNAENIVIDNCTFDGVKENVIDYYRGGYDESTVGGNLVVSNSTFVKCGADEKSDILLKTYGIINVNISDNNFKNNSVQKVALLWGAKNNKHSNNEFSNSGKIVVEENLKLKTFY